MKKLSIYVLLAIVAIAGFTSCEEDGDAVAPSLQMLTDGGAIASDATVEPGAVLFSWRADAGDADLQTFTIKQGTGWAVDDNGKEWNGETELEKDSKDTYADTAVFTITTEGEYTFVFTVTDKDGETDASTVKITVEQTATGTAITTYTGKTIGDIAYNTTTGGYFATSDGTVYAEDASGASDADFGYLCGNSYPKCIFSVDVSVSAIQGLSQGPGNISPQNSTRFETTSLSASEFDAIGATIDSDDIIEDNVDSPSDDYLNNVAAGDVIGFTAGGKKGLIKIKTADGSCGSTGLTLSFDVKIQD